MKPEIQTASTQPHIGSEQCSPTRYSYEFNRLQDINLVLATWPAEKLDAAAIENSRFFKARFGFDACTVVRLKVVAFQRRFDLTDNQIHFLQRAGFLRAERSGLRVESCTLLGWTQIALLVFMNLLILDTISIAHVPSWQKYLGLILFIVISVTSREWVSKSYVKPKRLLQACGALGQHLDSGRTRT